jgi:hypothetical protein
MRKVLRGTVSSLSFLAVMLILMALGCKKDPAVNNPSGTGPAPGKFGRGPAGEGKRGPIAEIMGKLTKGPESLTTVIGTELNADPPPWDKLEPQAKEFVTLASSMGKLEPPKGSKESWAKFTSSYSDTALALEKAVQAKDKEAARTAQQTLSSSCMACHKEHRGMGGFGPPGGFGKFGPPGKFGPGGGKSPDGQDKPGP